MRIWAEDQPISSSGTFSRYIDKLRRDVIITNIIIISQLCV